MIAFVAATAAAALLATSAHSGSCELLTVRREAANHARCVACHDGSAGPGIGIGFASHMVGRRYASAWLGARGGLKAIRHGSPVVLHDGYVTCTSCHDPQSRLPKHVAARDLCAECHAK